jgi:hypothetical protein
MRPTLDGGKVFAKIMGRWQRSSVAEQGTHKPLAAGSNPAVATLNALTNLASAFLFGSG